VTGYGECALCANLRFHLLTQPLTRPNQRSSLLDRACAADDRLFVSAFKRFVAREALGKLVSVQTRRHGTRMLQEGDRGA